MGDPIFIMMALAIAALCIVRRREILVFRFAPDRSTWAALGASAAIFACSAAIAMPGFDPFSKSLILHAVIYAGFGVAFPLFWVVAVERKGLSALAIGTHRLWTSLALNLGLGAFLITVLILSADWAAINMPEFWRAALVLLTGNFFELVFYYGFVHLRLRDAFGTLPAVIGTAFVYVLWHTGTELVLVEDPWRAALFLFAVGLLFQSVFALTYNLTAIFPVFVGAGVMLDFAVNIEALSAVAPFVGWSFFAWVLYLGAFVLAFVVQRRSALRDP